MDLRDNFRARFLRLVLGAGLVGVVMAGLLAAGVLDSSAGGDADIVIASATVDLETPGGAERAVGPREGELAPDFEASDFEGNRLRLSDLRGRPVLVNFWATWCAPCRAELPDLQALSEVYAAQGLVVVSVNHGETLGRARGYLGELGISLTHLLLDPDLDIVNRYELRGMPMSFFIDGDGVITRVILGRGTYEQLEDAIRSAIAGSRG